MRANQLAPLASALLAAVAAMLVLLVPALAQIEEPWNIVVVSEMLALARLTFSVALAHALVLGLPLFLLLRSKGHAGIFACSLGGFLVGAAPFGAFALIAMFGLKSASVDGVPTVVNGVPTFAGLIQYAQEVAFIGIFGVAGGLTFWTAMRLAGQTSAEPINRGTQSSKMRARSWGVVAVAGLLTCTIFLIPSVATDNSCHNLFRDGRTSATPQISADVNLSSEDWAILRNIFSDFGAAHSMSFRRDQKLQSGQIVWRDLNLCNEQGVNIDFRDSAWLKRTHSPLADRGMHLTVFELKEGSGWQPLTRELLDRIETAWPQKTTFDGPNGNHIPIDEALKGRK